MGEWIACKDQIADKGKMVLVQTKRGEMFIAETGYSHSWSRELSWFSYGTGGRRMKVMSKVVAWMPLPSPYKEGGIRMIKICDEWYFKNDGSQYILIRQYEKEKMKFGTKETTGEMRTVTEEIGYFSTLQFMLKKLAKIILAKEEIDSLGAYIDRLEQLEEKLCGLCKGY